MKDKVIVITGSTSGIGLGIAKRFAQEKATIVINGFSDQDNVNKITADLISIGAKEVLYNGADLSKHEEINSMFSAIIAKFGKVDVLINNAGIQFVSPIEDFPSEKWESIIQLNLVSSFHTIKNVIPIMKKNNWGRIINIASTHALVASPFKSAYVAAKHGLLGLTKTVALEVAQNGITANAICPGYVKTPLVLNQVADTAKARGMSEDDVIKNIILGAQATKKFVEIEEIAELALYLSGNLASSITGSALTIDGGWTAQ
jgi:3-hydroxybutyrate dehydrogenase